jgi:HlyD family secretion protein
VSAREDFEVVKNQAESDVDKAQLAYDFSEQDLEKYIDGEYPNDLKTLESKITLAQQELTRAEEDLAWSKKLFDEKYISGTELEADELALKQKQLDLELAQNNLNLLKDFTHKRKLAQLESDVSQAKMSLERTIRKAKADVVQAEASLHAKESEFSREKDKLQKIEKQIEKAKIVAPADGVVIYATSAEQGGHHGPPVQPLEEGSEVRERQDLLHLPTKSGVNAEIGVYESSLDKVSIGLPVEVTVDALPGQKFTGRVASIAPLPDADAAFMNPDLKIYDTLVYLDSNGNTDLLRTGMSCNAEIIVEQHDEAVYVPVQAVIRTGGKPTVYIYNGKDFEPREVVIGMDNNRMVHVKSGLEPGEIVSLAPPLRDAEVATQEYEKLIDVSDVPEIKDIPAAPVKEPGSGTPSTGQGGPGGGSFMEKFDTDNDGQVSKDEFTGPADAFSRFDKNGDDIISADEAPTGPPGGNKGAPPDGGEGGPPGGGPGGFPGGGV